MDPVNLMSQLNTLSVLLDGDLLYDEVSRLIYATDASAYRQKPLAIALPKHKNDIRNIIIWSRENKIPITPRTAGTSLAGQVVSEGLIVDVSRYMNRIIEVNKAEKWVRVEPGVILDELNQYLKPFGLFFGPETSTSNRCMMGGMLGNNACGAHSILYGSTRDHTLEVSTILSDGSEAGFSNLTTKEFENKCTGESLESDIYRSIRKILTNESNKESIRADYPDPIIPRRNTGYALDLLLKSDVFTPGEKEPFNFSRLLAGSEGTLAFTTEIKLNLVDLPPAVTGLVCVHFKTLEEAFLANLIALKHKPGAVEMMDNIVLELTKSNIEQQRNRFFVKGKPTAILIIEFARETRDEIEQIAKDLEANMQKEGYGYYFPLIFPPDVDKVWDLRKAGLGVLSNMKGDAKPVSLIEDTAVNVNMLPDYMGELKGILDKHNKKCVYYAHIGSGEIHLRPILNLKDPGDVELFRTLGLEVATLVKKYHGSMSGEHGDGRLRGEFIPIILGNRNYELLKEVKKSWDPLNILNPGKIVDTPIMNTCLRYTSGQVTPDIETIFDFSDVGGIVRAAEKCNGSGDCRKTEKTGGTMCPSYMATRDEHASTRARANLLRELLSLQGQEKPFDHKELYGILDLCLSCKGCKSECPSSVDIAKMKAEFLQHYYDDHGIPIRTRVIANISKINRIGAFFPALFNLFAKSKVLSFPIKKILKFAVKRSIPAINTTTLRKWVRQNLHKINPENPKTGTVYLFIDEFTNYNDASIGIKTIRLLIRLGYKIETQSHAESGRAYISKGLIRKARRLAEKNIEIFGPLITEAKPLIGIEPSAILSFRDEYPDLLRGKDKQTAQQIANNTFMIDEFLIREMEKGHIKSETFTENKQHIKLHGHCQQKSIASTEATIKLLSLPKNYTVEEISSGCCGMAGSFGYEKEHYDLSMKIGELVLFPAIREASEKTIIAAPGTSCRHQIKDGTKRTAYHPVEVLYDALRKNEEQRCD